MGLHDAESVLLHRDARGQHSAGQRVRQPGSARPAARRRRTAAGRRRRRRPAAAAATAAAGQTTGQSTPTGAARLRGPTKCVARKFHAMVTGRQIARVRFYVDGKLVSTRTRPNGPGMSYRYRVDPAKYPAARTA